MTFIPRRPLPLLTILPSDTFAWVDRKKGICATFMVNTAPSKTLGVFDFWEAWEREIYRSL